MQFWRMRRGSAPHSQLIIQAEVGIRDYKVTGVQTCALPIYEGEGIAGLDDDARSGRPRTIDHREIVAVTLAPPPRKYGGTPWPSRLLGRHLGISNGTIAKAWRD